MKNKLLIIFPNYSRGGAETAFNSYVDALSDYFNVHIIVNKNYQTDIQNLGKTTLENESFFNSMLMVFRAIKNYDPDAVITFKGHAYLTSILFFLKKILNKKFIIIMRESNDVHGYMTYEINNFFKKIIFKYFLKMWPAFLSDLVICNSRGSKKNFMQHIRKQKILNIYNPLYKNNELNVLDEKQYHVGFFGRYAQQKNPVDFIKIVSKLKERIPNIKAIMVGSGSLKNLVLKNIDSAGLTENIETYDFVGEPKKLLSKTKVLVLTSNYEGMPNILIEALKNRCLLASYDCPSGPNEIISGSTNGVLLPSKDIPAAAIKIQQLLKVDFDKNQAKEVLNAFTKKSFIKKIKKIFS